MRRKGWKEEVIMFYLIKSHVNNLCVLLKQTSKKKKKSVNKESEKLPQTGQAKEMQPLKVTWDPGTGKGHWRTTRNIL